MARDARLDAERAARADLRDAVDELWSAEIEAGRRRPSRLVRVFSAVALFAVLLAVAVVAVWSRADDTYTDDDYLEAATARVSVLLSPDHRRPDQARRILDGATGEFRDEFAQSADSYTTFVRSQGTIGRGVVDGAGVAARAGDSAAVLVAATVEFTDATTPADAVAETVVRRFRLRVLVSPDDGQLKLAAVQYLP
ncbi:hypothetical protein [Gordonia rhizosphera]|uniref:Uncharacterized protein n=1 Tax=Gordonia rhizosphera NBRC 16068 TaxID=1108045 RepID=K6VSW3_9ACTN|nr:hypothetical protein [Gordonia rhizosphera]GAB90000.1 hypothetical protein GORHZ_078_00560 [Gordonia rhizosphera NBRC 16068]